MRGPSPSPDRAPVVKAMKHCRDVTRHRARNFYYGLKLTPEPQRSALYSIYAWMRRADDLVDGVTEEAEQRRREIAQFRVATDEALSGRTDGNEHLWIALADTAMRFDIPRESFQLMLEGQLADLAGAHYATFSDVRDYSYRVASSVGLICISVWGYNDPAAREMAVDRGIAFQLTNILRDYKEDYDDGRVYLPAEDIARHGLTALRLRQWEDPAACTALIGEQVERTRSYYERSAPLDGMIGICGRPTLWAMTSIYGGLLAKIARSPQHIVGDRRVRLSSLRKGTIALRARWAAGRGTEAPQTVSEA